MIICTAFLIEIYDNYFWTKALANYWGTRHSIIKKSDSVTFSYLMRWILANFFLKDPDFLKLTFKGPSERITAISVFPLGFERRKIGSMLPNFKINKENVSAHTL